MARQGAEARRPKIPVNEKVGGDQTEANINGQQPRYRGWDDGEARKGESWQHERSAVETIAQQGILGRIDFPGMSLGCEMRGVVHR